MERRKRSTKKNRKLCSVKSQERAGQELHSALSSFFVWCALDLLAAAAASSHVGSDTAVWAARRTSSPFLSLGAGSLSDVVWVMSGTWLRSQGKGREL